MERLTWHGGHMAIGHNIDLQCPLNNFLISISWRSKPNPTLTESFARPFHVNGGTDYRGKAQLANNNELRIQYSCTWDSSQPNSLIRFGLTSVCFRRMVKREANAIVFDWWSHGRRPWKPGFSFAELFVGIWGDRYRDVKVYWEISQISPVNKYGDLSD